MQSSAAALGGHRVPSRCIRALQSDVAGWRQLPKAHRPCITVPAAHRMPPQLPTAAHHSSSRAGYLPEERRIDVISESCIEQVVRRAAASALALAIVCLASVDAAQAVTTEQLLFLEAWRAVDRAYVDKSFNGQSWFRVREAYLKKEPMKNREETYAAIRKLVSSLDDPFTRFLEPSRLEALRRGASGSVTGIGVEITFDSSTNQLVVVTPSPGGPAEQAGIRPGDVIMAVDGVPTQGLSLYEASDLLQGEEGSSVRLSLGSSAAAAGGSVREVEVTRQRVVLNSVTYAACPLPSPSSSSSSSSNRDMPAGDSGGGDGGGGEGAPAAQQLGYIRVTTFSSNTVPAFQEALKDLQQQGAGQRLVLDLRNNGGGLFPAGVQLGKLLLDRGDIVLIADSAGVRDIYSADGTAIDARSPLAVLVNRGTASASEVLAGALKDNRRASIVGSENTFGKGLIQTVVDLSDGSGVAITVARYQTPSGTDINQVGVAPDIFVPVDQMPPSGGEAFCAAMAMPFAPTLFK